MGIAVIGREAELGTVEDLVGAVESGPAALVIEGEAGIGKTTLWDAGLEAARDAGVRVLACRGAASEVKLGYAALTDLVTEVDEGRIAELPAPQRRALEAALLRAGPAAGAPPDPRAVATGFLTLLEGLAGDGPLLLAIDELQWLDRSSAGALRFAARRLRGPIGVLAARRNPPEPPPSDQLRLRVAERLRMLRLGPLRREEIHRLLRERTGRSFTPPILRWIDRIAAGNPFVAIELARALTSNRQATKPAFPESLRELVSARLSGLDDEVLEALLLAAALTRPRVAVIQQGLERGDAAELLGRAEAAEVVAISSGEVAFSHPVLASGVYSAAAKSQRRAAHRRLAAVVEGTEERARHLALASTEADREVIAALDEAAAESRARGAPADAAELLGLAFGLGADTPGRLIAAAESHFVAGDLRQAEALAERALNALEPGPERARALGLLGRIRHSDSSFPEAAELLEQAIAEADPGTDRVMLGLAHSYVLTGTGRLREAASHAATAAAEAERLGDDGLLADALAVRAMLSYLVGEGVDEPGLERALELEDVRRPTPIMLTPSLIAGRIWGWTGAFDRSRPALERARRRCLEDGNETEFVYVGGSQASPTLIEAGDLDLARELVNEVKERASQLDTPAALASAEGAEATLAGWIGDAALGRRLAHESLALFESIGEIGDAYWTILALGRLELSVARYEPVTELLLPVLDALFAMGWGEPATPPFLPDAIEALVALDRLEEARPLVAWLDERAKALRRPQLIALAARCRGLLLVAEGELDAAEDALAEALTAHERQPLPFDQARTLLVMGDIQRRRRRRRAAGERLDEARAIFERLEALLWVARCETELARLGLRRGPGRDELTPAELQVALAVSKGATNQEVAAALFVSRRTVEAHLNRIYRKLAIRSRSELTRLVLEGRLPGEAVAGA